jgi:hypothetical protein
MSQVVDLRIRRKPQSAFAIFSTEFKEILRQRFPFLTMAQILKAVQFKWSKLTKDIKAPFE